MLLLLVVPPTCGTYRLGFGLQMVHAADIQKAKTSKPPLAFPPVQPYKITTFALFSPRLRFLQLYKLCPNSRID